jgi:lysophospholipid acyltransferase (LPLAT)-like uncharacterized protein
MGLKLTLLPPIGAGLIRLLGKSLRMRFEGFEVVEELYQEGRAMIFAFWHGRQLMMPLAYRGEAANILISRHRDGELIHRIAVRFGLKSVRGSTNRGGESAFRRLVELGRAGEDLVVTPDGPRGPRHVVKNGVIRLAKTTGLPVVPVTFSCSKKKSSQVGTALWFPIRSAAACSFAENRFGSRPMPVKSNWKPSGLKLRRPLTGLLLRRIKPCRVNSVVSVSPFADTTD